MILKLWVLEAVRMWTYLSIYVKGFENIKSLKFLLLPDISKRAFCQCLLYEVRFFCFLSYWHQPTTRNLRKPSWSHFHFPLPSTSVSSSLLSAVSSTCVVSLLPPIFSLVILSVSCSLLSFLLWKNAEDCDVSAASSLPSFSSLTKPQNSLYA